MIMHKTHTHTKFSIFLGGLLFKKNALKFLWIYKYSVKKPQLAMKYEIVAGTAFLM